MNNSDAQMMMRFENEKKSVGVAYLFWLVLGGLGAHRFYLDRSFSATVIMLMTLFSMLFMIFLIGFITILIPATWVFIDLFLIPGMTADYNREVAARLTRSRTV